LQAAAEAAKTEPAEAVLVDTVLMLVFLLRVELVIPCKLARAALEVQTVIIAAAQASIQFLAQLLAPVAAAAVHQMSETVATVEAVEVLETLEQMSAEQLLLPVKVTTAEQKEQSAQGIHQAVQVAEPVR
jgi:hypothetical protein